ncbi:peptidylprolyl isomerase [Clostridium sp. 'deep sea']|uniref:peptidylprolyl isomerase n=1 Tax=Clostridium sp. 'deep sea' TaxID=2779445 RepID=UPI0018965330|nr:peptidylprolyl isomerase [Clostridium sp. 'deep sea']QOR35291.1 peptidylprolyl isomerase [Clostridium sp. 'deep sea']
MKNPIITLHMNNGKQIKLELYVNVAPNTVSSIITTALAGQYNGSEFYRVIKDFVLQTGCSEHDNYNMYSSYRIKGEFKANNFLIEQPKFRRGIVGMGGIEPKSSNKTSFFIMTSDLKDRPQKRKSLDDNYAAIGKVIEGLEEVMRINELATHNLTYNGIDFNTPKIPQIIEKVVVETFGQPYLEPSAVEYGLETKAKIAAMGKLLKTIKN